MVLSSFSLCGSKVFVFFVLIRFLLNFQGIKPIDFAFGDVLKPLVLQRWAFYL